MTGKRGPAGELAVGVRATIAVPAQDLVGEAQASHAVRARGELHAPPSGIWKMSVPPAGSSTSARSRKRANAWQSLQRTKRKPLDGEMLLATPRMRPHRHRSGRSKGMRDSLQADAGPSGSALIRPARPADSTDR